MSTARDQILNRIRAIPRTSPESVARTYRRTGRLSPEERCTRFHERVSDYQADVRLIGSSEISRTIDSICIERGAHRLGYAQGLPDEWLPERVELIAGDDLQPAALDALDGVITGCTAAIAETGTIILSSASTEGRRAMTLVPDVHICVVRETQIVELVPEAIALLHDLVAIDRRPVTFVSGPSATSDIELSRVEGVHGPRTLIVLVAKEKT